MSNLRRLPMRTAVLRGFDPSLLLDLDFRMGSGNDIDNANSRDLRYGLPAPITYSGGDNGTYFNGSGVLQTSGADEPRFDHDSSGNPLGLLIEEARTNHFLNSGVPATQTSGALGTGEHTLWMVGTGSVAVAANSATITGAGTATEGSPVTFNVTAGGTVDYTVTGSPTRAQSEKGSFATSYIPTAGSSVTRTADVATIALSGVPGFDENNYTILAGFLVAQNTTSARVLAISDGTTGDRAELLTAASDEMRVFQINTGGGGGTDLFTTNNALVLNTEILAAVAWAENDVAGYVDGEILGADSAISMTVGTTTIYLGSQYNGVTNFLNGHITRIALWSQRILNGRLRTLTT